MRRTTSRARVSSRTSASLRPTSRLTTASAIRPATSSRRAMPEVTGYTSVNRGVKHNYTENRSKVAIHLRQKQAESRAFPGETVDLHPAAVGLGESLHQAQAEPEAPGCGGLGMGNAHVLVEDPGQMLGGDPDPVVLDRDLHHARPVRRRARGYDHATAARGVLHRVGQQVLHHPIERVRIGVQREAGRGSRPLEPMLSVLGREELDVALEQRVEVDRLRMQVEWTARLDAREIEQLADDAPESARLGVQVDET